MSDEMFADFLTRAGQLTQRQRGLRESREASERSQGRRRGDRRRGRQGVSRGRRGAGSTLLTALQSRRNNPADTKKEKENELRRERGQTVQTRQRDEGQRRALRLRNTRRAMRRIPNR